MSTYKSAVLIGNWAEERLARDVPDVKPRFEATTVMRATYQRPTAVEPTSVKLTPSVEKPLLFAHGTDLERTSFATMYDSAFGARIPAHALDDAPRKLNDTRVKREVEPTGPAARYQTSYGTHFSPKTPEPDKRFVSGRECTRALDSVHLNMGLRQPVPLRVSPLASLSPSK